MKEVVIIDGYHLAYRMAFSLKNLSITLDGEVIPTGMPYGFFRNGIFFLKDSFPGAEIVVAWDRKPTKKLALNPEYKAGRVRSAVIKEAFTVMDWLKMAVQKAGIKTYELEGEEADDVAATLAYTVYKDHTVWLYTADDDYLQLVTDRVKVLKPVTSTTNSDKKVCDSSYVQQEWGVLPEGMPLLRSMTGDSSDNLPGIPRIPRKLASLLASKARTPDEMFGILKTEDWSACGLSKKTMDSWIARVGENESLVRSNYEMMVLARDLELVEPEDKKDLAFLEAMFTELKFGSLLGRIASL